MTSPLLLLTSRITPTKKDRPSGGPFCDKRYLSGARYESRRRRTFVTIKTQKAMPKGARKLGSGVAWTPILSRSAATNAPPVLPPAMIRFNGKWSRRRGRQLRRVIWTSDDGSPPGIRDVGRPIARADGGLLIPDRPVDADVR